LGVTSILRLWREAQTFCNMKLLDLFVDEKSVLISQIMTDRVLTMYDFSLRPRSRLNRAFLCYYAACSGNSLRSFETTYLSLETVSLGCSETSVRNYHYTPSNSPEERSSQVCVIFTLIGRFFA